MRRSGKSTKQTHALQKTQPESAGLSGVSDTKAGKYICKTVSADGTEGPEFVISQDLNKITGTHSADAAEWILNQVVNARVWPRLTPQNAMEKGFAAIAEIAPSNATEAMLATQMIAANDAALMFLSRATRDNQDPAITDMNVARATKLMRVFTEQIEAMQKLKGTAGQQKVTVEHVTVNQGGQAIVGAVTAQGPGVGDDRENR